MILSLKLVAANFKVGAMFWRTIGSAIYRTVTQSGTKCITSLTHHKYSVRRSRPNTGGTLFVQRP